MEFRLFSPTHWFALASVLVLGVGVVAAGARAGSADAERRIRLVWIGIVIALQGGTQVWTSLPARFELTRTLPLHICDIVPWIGIAALLAPRRWMTPVAYFWGTALSIWALILPILSVGPNRLEFWLFWLGHGQIVTTAGYLVVVSGFRPRWSDLRVALIATLAYTAIVLPIDVLLEADYGYLGRASAVSELGPWPERVLVLLVAEALLFCVFLMPWIVFGRRGASPTSQSS